MQNKISKILFFCFVLGHIQSNSLAQKITGKVSDTQKNPIAYVSIGIPNKNIGTYSFEDGSFELLVSVKNAQDTLIFSAIGYLKKSFLVSELVGKNAQIVLETQILELDEVTVHSDAKPSQYGIFKKNSSSDINIKNPFGGAEIAVLISPIDFPFLIEKIYLNVLTRNIAEYQLRIKFYSVHPQDKTPMDLIETQEIIFKTTQLKGTLQIPLAKPTQIQEPFYIVFEWLVNKKLSQSIQQYLKKRQNVIEKYVKSLCEGCTVVIYDQKNISVENEKGIVQQTFKLKKTDQQYLANLEITLPKLAFQTTKKTTPTYYRSKSFGKWYRYQQSLIAGVEGY
jgi:hypothetical protein